MRKVGVHMDIARPTLWRIIVITENEKWSGKYRKEKKVKRLKKTNPQCGLEGEENQVGGRRAGTTYCIDHFIQGIGNIGDIGNLQGGGTVESQE